MTGAIIDVVASEFSEVSDKVMFIKEKYFCEEETIYSNMLLLPSVTSLKILLNKFGMEI
jgi:chemotaxis protein CheC